MKFLLLVSGVAAILCGCDSGSSTSVQAPAPSPAQNQGLTKEDREEIATLVSERLQAVHEGQPTPAPISDAEFEDRVRREVAAVLEKERAEMQRQEKAPPVRSEQLSNAREQANRAPQQSQYRAVAAETPETGYDRFYEELTPYGRWYEDSDYGYIWQPFIASSTDWRPYVDGQWIYTDEGWNWVSNEPFGWATYHYGRWTDLDGIGWVWVPGTEWAPAWVSWRNDDENIGWAPLPPRSNYVSVSYSVGPEVDTYYDIGPGAYCFVPVARFGAVSYRGIVIPREQNIRIIERTRNVTRITIVNRRVRCDGPNFEFIRTRSRETIRYCRIVESNDRNRFDKTRPVAIYRGDDIEVYAPRINVKVNVSNNITAQPKHVERKIVNKTEKTGWEIVKNDQDKVRIRESMAKTKEATVVHYDTPNRNDGPKLSGSETPKNNNRPKNQDNDGRNGQNQNQNQGNQARLNQPPAVDQSHNNHQQQQERNRQEKQEKERQERQRQNEMENQQRQQAMQQQLQEQQRQRQQAEQQEQHRQRQQAERQHEQERQRQQQQAEQEQENQRQRQQAEQQQQERQRQQPQQQQPRSGDGQRQQGNSAGGGGNKSEGNNASPTKTGDEEDPQGKGRNRRN